MTERFDVVVIGAGIIGTSIAFSMSKAGWGVLVVDPLAGSGQGATSSSVAMVRTQYSTPRRISTGLGGISLLAGLVGFSQS